MKGRNLISSNMDRSIKGNESRLSGERLGKNRAVAPAPALDHSIQHFIDPFFIKHEYLLT
jgi:hypothetical protein